MKKLRILVLVILSILTLSACGQQKQEESETKPEETKQYMENLFEQLPEEFIFTSGVGAWKTVLDVKEDGSFAGQYTDFEESDTGKKYKNGTQYESSFSGVFATPTLVEEYTYSTRIQSLNIDEKIGKTSYKDGVRIVYSGPYGLEKAEQIRIYLPGKSLTGLSEELFLCAPFEYQSTQVIPQGCYCIHNVEEGIAFWGMLIGTH